MFQFLEEWGRGTGVRCPDANVVCNSWCDAVNGDWRGNLFALNSISVENQRELKKRVSLHLLCSSVFINNVPAW